MRIDSNWAPPTIGDIRVPDRDLGRRLSRQPSVEMRAKLLGLDWTALMASRTRLLRGAWITSAAVATLAIASGLVSSSHVSPWIGSATVVATALASMFAIRPVSRFPLLIARNDPSTADSYRAVAKLSPNHSLLGYRVRWILLRHAATTVWVVTITTLIIRSW